MNLIANAAALLVLCLPALASAQTVRPETVASGLEHPWGLAFLPEGRFLVTERPGRLRVIESDGTLGPPVAGLPKIDAGGQGGLLDVVTDSAFAANRTLYFCFAEPGPGGNSTALARARLSVDRSRLEAVQVIFSQKPKVTSPLHFGCRVVEARDGTLFLALCRAAGVPARLHFSLIDKRIQRGLFHGLAYRLLPKRLSHSWLEVEIDGTWRRIDGYINDAPFFSAALGMPFLRRRRSRSWSLH